MIGQAWAQEALAMLFKYEIVTLALQSRAYDDM